jgi:hypothetical protein
MRRLSVHCPGIPGHSGCAGCPLKQGAPERPQIEIQPRMFANGYCMSRRAAERKTRNP